MQKNNKPFNIDLIKKSTNCGNINYFESVNSTNSWLLEHGQCGDVCISESQTAGRGRRGNTWISPTGNVYFSLCWCFTKSIEHMSLLGLVVGTAIAEALSDIGLEEHGIKWPNDIFWQQKKLGGILLETVDQSGRIVIGIGINISHSIDKEIISQPVISLNEAMENPKVSKDQLIICLIQRLQEKLIKFTQLNFDQFRQEWQAWDILYGKQVSFMHQGINISGRVTGIDKHGRLGILKNERDLCYYSTADISLNKQRGRG